jgi:small-conductance mechanosensitive channel
VDLEKGQSQIAPPSNTELEKHATRRKVWIGTYILLALVSLAVYFIFRLKDFDILGTYKKLIEQLSMAGFVSFMILLFTKIIEGIIIKRSHTKAIRYNIIRLIRLLTICIISLVIITFLNANWYTAAVSLGLISLILGFALQTPIASLIGWFYIIIRVPYKVGDCIQVDTFTGDVVEIGYFDTTLGEFAGNYMTNDLPSGRLIRFPNSLVFADAVYNYSWKKFPYIWNEIPFHVAYESDLEFVEKTIRTLAKEELGTGMEERVAELRNIIKQTLVDELEIKEYPFVNFRINANTWVEVLLIYLVEPKQSAALRSRLIKRILKEFNKEPDRVLFPKTNSR